MKILLVMSRPEREEFIMQKIKSRIHEIDKYIEVKILYRFSQDFLFRVLQFEPNVIMSHPFNGPHHADIYYIVKFITKCSVICFRTEGMLDFNSPNHIKLHVGEENEYDENLVDYEVFWGPKVGEKLGSELVKQKKLLSKSKIVVTGYPMYERYFLENKEEVSGLSSEIKSKIHKYNKKNILLFVTGFQGIDETEECKKNICKTISNSEDEYKKVYNDLLMTMKEAEVWREKFKQSVINIAKNNKDTLIIVKLHPIEINIISSLNKEPFKELGDYKNIVYIKEPLPMNELLSYCGVFFHFGSTSLMEAYLSKVPSIYVTYKDLHYSKKFNLLFFKKFPIPSTEEIDVTELEAFYYDYMKNGIDFKRYNEMDLAAYEYFNIKNNDNNYNPSKETASLLVNCGKIKENDTIDESNKYLKSSIINCGLDFLKIYFELFLKRINLKDYYSALKYINNINVITKLANLNNQYLNYFKLVLKDNTIQYNDNEFEYNKECLNNYLLFKKDLIEEITSYNSLRVLIFGSGKFGNDILKLIKTINKFDNKQINIVGFVDNNKEKWGKSIENIKILEPGNYLNIMADKIIIASQWHKDIEKQLFELGLPKQKVLTANYKKSLLDN
ncbi:hypothetical protein [Clostridium sp. JS66]|uniref:hypothetical protein n=1 Tax=Clostridium sp. JS66 TaxID=3064705 RepID=UPI00298D8F16|nr:hypothetical protein [Clostridium sp. JS66]WPC41029.1 hypothetical protein Q6H37_24535 [Clostridium sp. JS66]